MSEALYGLLTTGAAPAKHVEFSPGGNKTVSVPRSRSIAHRVSDPEPA